MVKYEIISTPAGDRIVFVNEGTAHCCFCLQEIEINESCLYCPVNKNIYCTKKTCKSRCCRGVASMNDHTDIFSILKRK